MHCTTNNKFLLTAPVDLKAPYNLSVHRFRFLSLKFFIKNLCVFYILVLYIFSFISSYI